MTNTNTNHKCFSPILGTQKDERLQKDDFQFVTIDKLQSSNYSLADTRPTMISFNEKTNTTMETPMLNNKELRKKRN